MKEELSVMDDFEQHLKAKMKVPEFRAYYDDLEAEYSFVNAVVRARNSTGLIQQQLRENQHKPGCPEPKKTGKTIPSIGTLQKLAKWLE